MLITRLGMSPGQARQTVIAMRSGDRLVYHKGHLLVDRHRPGHEKMDRLAKFMLSAGVENGYQFCETDEPIPGLGLGSLTQRRTGSCAYEYLFTKS